MGKDFLQIAFIIAIGFGALIAIIFMAVFAAYFSREEDISNDEVLARICATVGIDAASCLAGMAVPHIKEQLKANTDEAMKRGAFGSPTFFVGDDMYFGNDRLPLVEAAFQRDRA